MSEEKTTLSINTLSQTVMKWMSEKDEFVLSTTKANKLVALCIAKIYQEKGIDLGPLTAKRLGPTNSEAQKIIKVPTTGTAPSEEEYENHFGSKTYFNFTDPDIDSIVQSVFEMYGKYSPQQIIAITHTDDEWFNHKQNFSEMDKSLMLV